MCRVEHDKHLNSTVLSHAFYLAIEGGRNATSGGFVTGVGAANRAQIEKVFFRAENELPNRLILWSVAMLAVVPAGATSASAQSR